MITNISRKLLAAALAFLVLGSMSSQQLVAMKRLRDGDLEERETKRRRVDVVELDVDEPKIQLQSSDDAAEPVTILKRIAMHSVTLKNMLDDLGDAPQGAIPLANTSEATLNHIVACLTIMEEKGKEAGEFLNNYVKNLSPQQLHQLIDSANYLDIGPLFDAAIKALSKYYSSDENKLLEQNPLLPEVSQLCAQHLSYFPELQGWLLDQIQPTTINGHSRRVDSVCFSPNGKTLASGSWDYTIKLWDVAAGECITTLNGHNNFVTSVCFSPDGKTLASGSWDKTIKLWGIATGECIATLNGHNNFVSSVCFSPDGKTLASGWDNSIKLWDIATGECIATLNGHNSMVDSVCFSSDGKILASGSDDCTIKLWKEVNGVWTCIKTFQGHSFYVTSVCFSPDGKTLASGSWDETIKIWDIATGKCIMTLNGHNDCVKSVCFNPDGKILASGSADDTIKLWDIATGERIKTVKTTTSAFSVCFSPDGKTLASGWDNSIKLWNVEILSLFKSINLEQAKFLNLVRKAYYSGQILDLNQDNVLAVFNSLQKELRKLLLEEHLVSTEKPAPLEISSDEDSSSEESHKLLLEENLPSKTLLHQKTLMILLEKNNQPFAASSKTFGT